jgi:hypothetical protein
LAARGARALPNLVVARDGDLLVLGKPFGIEMISPVTFLALLRENRRRVAR